MCGIIGYTGNGNGADIVLDGLFRLEYRGYDSAGVAAFCRGKIKTVKSVGRVENTARKIRDLRDFAPSCLIGHTRWATHGAPCDINAHPHTFGAVTLVHNGIVENCDELKREIEDTSFISATDTEIFAAYLNSKYSGDGVTALRCAMEKISGSSAFCALFSDNEGVIFAAKRGAPLMIGIADGGMLVASDITALLPYTKRYITLEDGDVAAVSPSGAVIYDSSGSIVLRNVKTADFNAEDAEKCGFEHFMLKEINEEGEALRRAFAGRVYDGAACFERDGIPDSFLAEIERVYIVACGTAYHAGKLGKYYAAVLAKIPVFSETASEFRYGAPLISRGDLVVVISQSGETADSIAALKMSKELGAKTLAVVNVVGSSIARIADTVLYMNAGPEISVASTKAYTVQAALMVLLAARLAYAKGKIGLDRLRKITGELVNDLPREIESIVSRRREIKKAADQLRCAESAFYIGRGADFFIAEEGSLKLKEISYIHSEAYPAGELKHGAIALVSDKTPVIAISTSSCLFEKTMSNVIEAESRGGRIVLICGKGFPGEERDWTRFELLGEHEIIAPILAATACQLLAYEAAVARGCDVDKPRNLAKSVTVE